MKCVESVQRGLNLSFQSQEPKTSSISHFRVAFISVSKCVVVRNHIIHMEICFRLNVRIPGHLLASHWIRIATIVIFLVLQSTPTHVNGVDGYSEVAPCSLTDSFSCRSLDQGHFHVKCFAPGLVLKQRHTVLRKWPSQRFMSVRSHSQN